LAADELDGVSAHAGDLADALRAVASAEPGAPGPVAAVLTAGSRSADQIASATTLDAARREFGELSRSVVALVRAEPRLQDGMHIFRCPMAEDYDNWLQASPGIENPYMGQE